MPQWHANCEQGWQRRREDTMMKNTLTGSNASIDQQIAAIQRQLDSEKERLSIGFQAMQNAQQNAKTMSDALTNAFSTSSK